jgi:hypothetical protein
LVVVIVYVVMMNNIVEHIANVYKTFILINIAG